MHKFSTIFAISFIPYVAVLLAAPYISARTWADICLLIFFASVVYQLCYVIYIRKMDKVGLGRSFARFFLYLFMALSCYIAIKYVGMFIFGYLPTDILGNLSSQAKPYYGFEAWKHNGFANILYLPGLLVAALYAVIYYKASKAVRR